MNIPPRNRSVRVSAGGAGNVNAGQLVWILDGGAAGQADTFEDRTGNFYEAASFERQKDNRVPFHSNLERWEIAPG